VGSCALCDQPYNRAYDCQIEFADCDMTLTYLTCSRQCHKQIRGTSPILWDGSGDTCSNCGLTGPDQRMTKCGRCKRERYCSRACQVDHWAKHKGFCVQAPREIERSSKELVPKEPTGRVAPKGVERSSKELVPKELVK
jgi:hypothetical protein